MDDIRKKVLLDLFGSPWVVIPMMIGVSFLMLSSILGAFTAFFGLSFFTLGVGAFFTNVLFNLKTITERAVQDFEKSKKHRRYREIEVLKRKLETETNDDSRDENVLSNLESLHKMFHENVVGKSWLPESVVDQIDQIFKISITQIEHSYNLYKMSDVTNGKIKNDLVKKRDGILDEVEQNASNIANAIHDVQTLQASRTQGKLDELNNKLQFQLQVAKDTESLLKDVDYSEYREIYGEKE